jgi:hypothetical protein
MEEHNFEYWIKEPAKQAIADGAAPVRAMAEAVLRDAWHKEDDGEDSGFLRTIYDVALIKANTICRNWVRNRPRE